jgi:hypothetical protein
MSPKKPKESMPRVTMRDLIRRSDASVAVPGRARKSRPSHSEGVGERVIDRDDSTLLPVVHGRPELRFSREPCDLKQGRRRVLARFAAALAGDGNPNVEGVPYSHRGCPPCVARSTFLFASVYAAQLRKAVRLRESCGDDPEVLTVARAPRRLCHR